MAKPPFPWYANPMTKLLDEAIAKVRELTEEEQDVAAEAILSVIHGDTPGYRLTPEQVAEVRRIREGLRNGNTRLATDEEMKALWAEFGL